MSESVRARIIKGRFFSKHRHIHAIKQFKLKYCEKRRIGQQNFSEQHRYENWFKHRHKKGLYKLAVTKTDVSKKIVTPTHNLKVLTKKHNDKKLAITLLIVGTGLIFIISGRK